MRLLRGDEKLMKQVRQNYNQLAHKNLRSIGEAGFLSVFTILKEKIDRG
jgi:hypothetical protein